MGSDSQISIYIEKCGFAPNISILYWNYKVSNFQDVLKIRSPIVQIGILRSNVSILQEESRTKDSLLDLVCA